MSKLTDKIDKLKATLDSPSTPEAFKGLLKKQIEELEAKAAKEKEKPVVKETPVAEPKQEKPKPVPGAEPNCEDLLQGWRDRRKAAKESAATSAKTPVFTKIAVKVADVVIKAIDNVPVKEIKEAPIKFFNKFEHLKEKAEDFLAAFKDVLGEDYNAAQADAEIRELEKFIGHLQDKYGK